MWYNYGALLKKPSLKSGNRVSNGLYCFPLFRLQKKGEEFRKIIIFSKKHIIILKNEQDKTFRPLQLNGRKIGQRFPVIPFRRERLINGIVIQTYLKYIIQQRDLARIQRFCQ